MSEIQHGAGERKGESSAKRAERIEGAIRSARAVAATPEARELHRRSAKDGDKFAAIQRGHAFARIEVRS